MHLIDKVGLDDAVDTVGVHGVGGWLGSVLLGVLADPVACASLETAPHWCANPGSVTRSWRQLQIQMICATVASLYAFVVTYLILSAMKHFNFISVLSTFSEQETARDMLQHGEIAYARMPWQSNEWGKCLEQCLAAVENAAELPGKNYKVEMSCLQVSSDEEKQVWSPRALSLSSNSMSLCPTPRDTCWCELQAAGKRYGVDFHGIRPL